MNVQTDAVAEAVSEVFAIPAGDDHLPCQRIDLLRRALVILQSLDADLRGLHDQRVDATVLVRRLAEVHRAAKVITIAVEARAEVKRE